MKCVRCGKPLSYASATFRTAEGPVAYGPKCARLAGVMPERERLPRARLPRRPRVDAAQLQLEFAR